MRVALYAELGGRKQLQRIGPVAVNAFNDVLAIETVNEK